MKKILFFSFVFLMLLGINAYAEESYLVWLDDSIQTFSAEIKTQGDGFYTMGETELQECLEAGVVTKYIPNLPVTLYETAWNQEAIKVAFPQSIGCRGNGVTVAVIDSGIQEIGVLEGRVLPGYNYIANSSDVTDHAGHGTFVSGIIAAGADQCKILPLKCFEGSTTDLQYILAAIYDAVVTCDVDVINMSFGFGRELEELSEAERAEVIATMNQYVSNASSLGTLVVAAVGNDGDTLLHYPAACTDAVGVGAVDQSNSHCFFSQYNESVFVVAPGAGVVSTAIEGYTGDSGTSFAAPHVTALAAIARSMNPDMTTAEFKALLQNTATDLGATGRDNYYGYGLLDCEAAVKELMEGETIYISPILQNGSRTDAVFYNNSQSDVVVSCIFACYDGEDNLLSAPRVQTETIKAGKTFTYENTCQSGKPCFMAWKNLSVVQPLGASRR
ncbi:MAG: S8 family serine peptidase [Clostridia bacterium]|nr:S8 family serine peptidase [Clostridia bacterium]